MRTRKICLLPADGVGQLWVIELADGDGTNKEAVIWPFFPDIRVVSATHDLVVAVDEVGILRDRRTAAKRFQNGLEGDSVQELCNASFQALISMLTAAVSAHSSRRDAVSDSWPP